MLDSMPKTSLRVGLVVAPLMISLIGRYRFGWVSGIPNRMPILSNLGIMGWVGRLGGTRGALSSPARR